MTFADVGWHSQLHYCHFGSCRTTVNISHADEYHCVCDKNVYVGKSCEVSVFLYAKYTVGGGVLCYIFWYSHLADRFFANFYTFLFTIEHVKWKWDGFCSPYDVDVDSDRIFWSPACSGLSWMTKVFQSLVIGLC